MSWAKGSHEVLMWLDFSCNSNFNCTVSWDKGEFLLGKKGKDYFLSLGKEEGQYYHQGSFQVQVKYKCDSLPLKWILLSPPE